MSASEFEAPRTDGMTSQGARQTSRATLLAFVVPAVAIFVLLLLGLGLVTFFVVSKLGLDLAFS